MKKMLSIALLLAGLGLFAQDSEDNSSLEGHYLGLQVNELVRQIFSLGNTNLPTNPYFLNYTYTSVTNEGVNMGFALNVDEVNTADNFNSINTKVRNFAFRIGYEKKKRLSKRFIYSMGLDVTLDFQKNETTNEDSFNSFRIVTTTKRNGWGMGPRFTFQYQISDNILIGTEANYYFKALKDEFSVRFSSGTGNNIDEESDVKQFTFAPPAILWLTVRL